MAKFASTLILVGVIITVQAIPPTYDEILAAARENQWDQVQELLRNNFAKNAEFKPAVFEGVRNLKPVDGGHVYGEAEYSFHSASNIDGKTTEDKAGHKVVNTDGKVKEFDFTPKTDLSSLIHPINPQAALGSDYSASDYSFQYAPSAVDQSADFNGGKKAVNTINIGQHTNLPNPPHSYTSVPSQGATGSHNSYNHQYSYSHSQQFVNGKPVDPASFLPGSQKPGIPSLTFTNVRDLKPTQGGQVFGEAQYQYHSTSNINGKVTEDQGGHKIINNNGQVQEFDFTPSSNPKKSPVTTYFN
ncbi:hypothetical protein PYW07_006989 [Mythimna separata]|uniref:Cuticle protein n=1 Tax=Mythimna separata TaxID=271217 RepID=A0AAD8DZK1_MYTSE|nr:hypothetical protein PYW07_006989 [Mythimna separata]